MIDISHITQAYTSFSKKLLSRQKQLLNEKVWWPKIRSISNVDLSP